MTLTELDIVNGEDILMVAVDILLEIKQFEPTVLNPHNSSALAMLEHALSYYPDSLRIKQKMIRIYSKLGCTKIVTKICKNIQPRLDEQIENSIYTQRKDAEKIGAYRLSIASSFDQNGYLTEVIDEFNTYFPKTVLTQKNTIVQKYLVGNFEDVAKLTQQNETYNFQPLWHNFRIAKCLNLMQNDLLDFKKTHLALTKLFTAVDELAELEEQPLFKLSNSDLLDMQPRRKLATKLITKLELGRSRADLLKDAMLEATFLPEGPQIVYESRVRQQIKENKAELQFFGYKHPKAFRFYAVLLRCLRHCYDQKIEPLNVDLNIFLLLKNELSLCFLRKEENMLQLLKTMIHLLAKQKHSQWYSSDKIEAEQLSLLQRYLYPESAESKEEQDPEQAKKDSGFWPKGLKANATRYEKIAAKVIHLNLELNRG